MDAIHEKMDYKITWVEFDFCEGTRKVSLNRILYIESKLHKFGVSCNGGLSAKIYITRDAK